MARPKTLEDEQVIDAARAAFAAHGHGVSTRRIAADIGLSQAALIQRFGSKKDLFLAAMFPEPLDIAWILNGDNKPKTAGADAALLAVTERLFTQMSARLPGLLQLAQNPEVEPSVIEDAHAVIGVPDLIDALCERVEAIAFAGAKAKRRRTRQIVEAMLLAAHGATLMRIAGASHEAIRKHLRSFSKSLRLADDKE